MALVNCICDLEGICPFEVSPNCDCEFYCGTVEPQDDPPEWEDESGDE